MLLIFQMELSGCTAQEAIGNDVALNLIRPLDNLQDLGVSHVAIDGVVGRNARRAKELHRIGGDFHGRVGGKTFGHGRKGGKLAAVDALIHHAGRVVDQSSGGVGLHLHVCQHPAHALKLTHFFAKSLSFA